MNDALVLDASLAVKWLVREEFSDQALALERDSSRDFVALTAPPDFFSEVANAVYQRVRTGDPEKHLSLAEAEVALDRFARVQIQLHLPPGLSQHALRLAHDLALPSMYDALYVVLARLVQAPLWTGDRRLFNAVRSSAPWVHFIGDYPLP